MLDLLENVLKRGLDMGGTDTAWYLRTYDARRKRVLGTSSPSRKKPALKGVQRKNTKAKIIQAELDLATALLFMGTARQVARWLHRDDTALLRAIRRQSNN